MRVLADDHVGLPVPRVSPRLGDGLPTAGAVPLTGKDHDEMFRNYLPVQRSPYCYGHFLKHILQIRAVSLDPHNNYKSDVTHLDIVSEDLAVLPSDILVYHERHSGVSPVPREFDCCCAGAEEKEPQQ